MKFRTHKRLFRAFWALLFKENLGTCRLAIKLEGTPNKSAVVLKEYTSNLSWYNRRQFLGGRGVAPPRV